MKKFLCLILSVILILSMTSCSLFDDGEVVDAKSDPNLPAPETLEELYSYYNQVERGMTRAQIEAKFGVGEDSFDEEGAKTFTTYKNEKKSAGVTVIYSFDDSVSAKILYYNNAKDLVKFCTPFDEAKLEKLEQDQLMKNVREILGDGLELSCEYSANSLTNFSKIYSWFNEDGSNLQFYTDNDVVKQMVLNKE
ncbi:MAG: hypothetical protein IKU25_02385 [Clostridia bacterium]|nr:hypothetical protein [Clostridia bacterium]